MTAWRLVPLNNGPHIKVRLFAGVDLDHVTEVGELILRPAEYGDLAARIGNTDGFSTDNGRPLAVVSVVNGYELLDETTRLLREVEAERDELAAVVRRYRPIVQAALAWRSARIGSWRPADHTLAVAVDALIADEDAGGTP